jgi:endonuclease/exonuclease/phosphatase family metal-dependent hydrolase
VPGTTIRVLAWNLFHGRDGLPGLGPDLGSLLCRRPVDDGTHLHLNRKLWDAMGARIAAWAPDLCALQEVSLAGLGAIVARTGMSAVWTTTGPLVGPARLRDALAAANPDLWRTHESNANALLTGPRLRLVPGTRRSVRLNPVRPMLRAAALGEIGAGELARYLPEPRRAVMALVDLPDGARVAVACAHCHNARDPLLTGVEIARAAAAVRALGGGGPAVLAGDLNAGPGHPALASLAREGWSGAAPGPGVEIDRILARGLEVVEPERALPASEREVGVTRRGRRRRVRLSDHAPVVAALRASGSRAGRPAGR